MADNNNTGQEKNEEKTTKKKWSGKKKAALAIIIAVCVAAAIAITYFAVMRYFNSKLDQIDRIDIGSAEDNYSETVVEAEEEEEEPEVTYTTIAFFGIDNRSNGSFESGNSDAIMVVAINDVTKEVRVASVYRDTYLCVSEGKFRKANYAYNAGGPTAAITMLQKNLDLQISDYIAVDFNALVEIIDLLGGIDVEVTEAEANEMYVFINETAAQTGTYSSPISAGYQTLDGVQAVAYARIRKLAGNDYGRAERQRKVVSLMLKKMKKASYSTLLSILNAVVDDISTSMTNTEMIDYAKDIKSYSIKKTVGFPFEKTTDTPSSTIGSIVIACDLVTNVEELHEFLYPEEEGYEPTETVKYYSQSIIDQLGPYTATDEE